MHRTVDQVLDKFPRKVSCIEETFLKINIPLREHNYDNMQTNLTQTKFTKTQILAGKQRFKLLDFGDVTLVS